MDQENRFEYLHKEEKSGIHISENAKITLFTTLAFAVPFVFPEPQLLTGIVVNALLVLSALNVRNGKKLLPIVMLPSIAAAMRGALFGPFAIALVYMIPFIWAGNWILVSAVRVLRENYAKSILVGAFAKSAFLFLCAFALSSFGLVPSAFLFAMGALQLVTAGCGGILAKGVQAYVMR
ncbi:MAG: hypothetical protein ACP5NX_01320 [Candidatus Bilamarchaeaceae archaeon]